MKRFNEHLPQKEPQREQKKRQKNCRRNPVQPLAKQSGLERTDQRGGVGTLPGIANADGILNRRLNRFKQASRIAPRVVGEDGEAEIIIAGMIIE